jgi:hypothetical protein
MIYSVLQYKLLEEISMTQLTIIPTKTFFTYPRHNYWNTIQYNAIQYNTIFPQTIQRNKIFNEDEEEEEEEEQDYDDDDDSILIFSAKI